jgi:WXG100 protein secretion system (Wss), protein YukD
VKDGRSRITVVGAARRVDVALPSDAPIGEYSAVLAGMCGQHRRGAAPAIWSLAAAGAQPLGLTASLSAAGVVDGQVLYLRDLDRDLGGPVVMDLDEHIAEESDRYQASGWPRSQALLSFGLLWVAASAALGLVRHADFAAALVLVAAGLALLGAGWALAQQRRPAPPALCVLTALASVPCFAVAGGVLGQVLAGGSFRWTAMAAGAAVAVLMCLAATPEAAVTVLGVQAGVALAVTVLLVAVRATRAESAAVVAVAALTLISLAKPSAARVAVWAGKQSLGDADPARTALGLLTRTRRLSAVLMALPAAALAVAVPVLALSGGGYGFAMAVTATLTLLMRAWQSGFAIEFVPFGAAGATGLFAVLAVLVGRIWPGPTVIVAALVAVGLLLVSAGIAAIAATPGAPDPAEAASGSPARRPPPPPRRPARRRFADLLGVYCLTATVVLTLGPFGVFSDLMTLGRGLLG